MSPLFAQARRRAAFAAGVAVAVGLLLAAGEAFLRWSPPRDFRRYLGDRSGLTGPFRADDRYGVQYRSWQAFRDDHVGPWPANEAAFESPRAWAMFGSSFVHMHGMLADTTRTTLTDRPV